MPAGVGWGRYVRFSIAAYFSMAAGSQIVHMYYNPLEDLKDLIAMHKERLLREHHEKIAKRSVESDKTLKPS